MPPREFRDFVSPLLQPPLNRLFVPRPLPEYLEPNDRDQAERQYVRVDPTTNYIRYLREEPAIPYSQSLSATEQRKQERVLRQQQYQVKLKEMVASYNPKGKETLGDSDPYKTLFVGRLPYDASEAKVRREFERFGPIRRVSMVSSCIDSKPRGYAFVEFERERDMKAAYVEADGLKWEGTQRRIVVDVERGRTVKGWLPRRLGGGLGKTRLGGRDQPQRHSGREAGSQDRSEPTSRKRSASPASRHGSREEHGRYGGSRSAGFDSSRLEDREHHRRHY